MATPQEEIIWKGSSSHVLNFWVHLLCWILCILLVPIFISLWKWLEVRSRVYEVTTERVKISQGIFSKRIDQLELYRVRDTTVVAPFLYRLFGKGNIILNTSDATTPTITIECVPDPGGLVDQMRQAIEACRDRKRSRVSELSGGADLDIDEHPAS